MEDRIESPGGQCEICVDIIEKVAEYKGIDSEDVSYQLYNSIDPDALEALFRPMADGRTRETGSVIFHFLDREVIFRSDGQVLLN